MKFSVSNLETPNLLSSVAHIIFVSKNMISNNKDDTLILENGWSLSEQAHETVALLEEESSSSPNDVTCMAMDEVRESVAKDMLGSGTSFASPFEWKAGDAVKVPLVYCDFTASHRPLKSIEKYIEDSCIPFYGNTHTNTSVTGSQSTAFCSEARQIIAETCGAKITGKASQDVVLFAGNGTTSAIQLLTDCLGLKLYKDTDEKPLIILGPYGK